MNSWLDHYPDFREVTDNFIKAGFSVYVAEEEHYAFISVESDLIKGGMCTPNMYSYSILSGNFVADRIESFYQWNKCPLVVSIPTDFDSILEQLEKLVSE